MYYTILGIEKIDYHNKEGKHITGTRLHLFYEDKNVNGHAVDNVYLSSNIELPVLNVGDQIDVRYNRYGCVFDVVLLKSKS